MMTENRKEKIMKRYLCAKECLLAGAVTLALCATAAPASAGQRPLSDFTSRQGAWCAVFTQPGGPDCAASYYVDAGPPCVGDDRTTFSFGQFWYDPSNGLYAGVDVLGQLDDGSFGTTVSGSVAENKLRGGLADVKVLVHGSNVLTRVIDLATGDLLFGHGYGEVVFDGAEPTLGEAELQLTFTNTAPGASLPDFNQLLSCPAPGQGLEVTSMRARASGPLRDAFGVPDGTPGRFEMTQTGPIGTAQLVDPHSRLAVDAFPAEHIIIRATGH
jgi:hypothetical protein